MSTPSSLCYIPGFGHNWTVLPGSEHLFIPNVHRKITNNPNWNLHYIRWGSYTSPENPFDSFEKYRTEELLSTQIETHQIIQDTIIKTTPKTIICNSMGSRALYHAVMNGLQLDSVSRVILLQPDIPMSYNMELFYHKLLDQDIDMTYTWCPWDDLMGIISLSSGELRLGQIPCASSKIKSHFFALKPTRKKWWHTQVLEQDISHILKDLGIEM